MLDVHPPHEAAHTWKDFFIHIATIVIGLLIAIALEQTVELIHRHHEAREARMLLREEVEVNRKVLRQSQYVLKLHEDYLFADLPVIDRVRTHTLKPNDIVVMWRPHPEFVDAAWQSLRENQTASLLLYGELQRYASIYSLQHAFNDVEMQASSELQRAQTVVYRSEADRFNYAAAAHHSPAGAATGEFGDAMARAAMEEQAPNATQLARLTPAEIDRMQEAIQTNIFADEALLTRCRILQAAYDDLSGK